MFELWWLYFTSSCNIYYSVITYSLPVFTVQIKRTLPQRCRLPLFPARFQWWPHPPSQLLPSLRASLRASNSNSSNLSRHHHLQPSSAQGPLLPSFLPGYLAFWAEGRRMKRVLSIPQVWRAVGVCVYVSECVWVCVCGCVEVHIRNKVWKINLL